MSVLQDRRVLLAAGAGAALVAGALIGVVMMRHPSKVDASATPAKGQLQVQMTAEQARADPGTPLRCFVGGQFVGSATLADCAKRNGVAAQALDVGLDQSGALAAGDTAQLQPLAPSAPQVARADRPNLPPLTQGAPAIPASAPSGECLRYGADGWRSVGGSVGLSACVQLLFDGRCQRPGEALYGRWSGQTLRLVPGRVESSGDNHDFHPLADQNPRDCSIPPL